MRLLRRNIFGPLLENIYGQPTAVRAKAIFKFCYETAPELVAALPLFIGSTVISLGVLYSIHGRNDLPKYSEKIRIFRPDDPRLERIRTTSRLDY